MKFRLELDILLGALNLAVFSGLWFLRISWSNASFGQYLAAGSSLLLFGAWSIYPLVFVHLSFDSEALLVRPWPLRMRARRIAWSEIVSWRESPKNHDMILVRADGQAMTIKLSRMFSGKRRRITAIVREKLTIGK